MENRCSAYDRRVAEVIDRSVNEFEVRYALDQTFAESRFAKLEASERGLRAEPAGRKSEATFNHIITTAAEVLDDVPLRDITTHLIADRAEVNIATLYRYFSDLESILVEFDIRYQKFALTGIKEMAVTGTLAEDRREWVNDTVDAVTVIRTDVPGALGISRDGQAIPQVRQITAAAEDVCSRMLAVAMGYYAPGLKPEEDWYYMFLTIVRTTSRLMDEACAQRPADLKQIEMLKELAFNFFEPHFAGS